MKNFLLAAVLVAMGAQADAATLYYSIAGKVVGDGFAFMGASGGDPLTLKIKVRTHYGRIFNDGQTVTGGPFGIPTRDLERRSPTAWWLFTVGDRTFGDDGAWQSGISVTPTTARLYAEANSENNISFLLTYAEIPGANLNTPLSTTTLSGSGFYNQLSSRPGSFDVDTFSIAPPDFSPVPLPASAFLMLGALAGLAGLRHRKRIGRAVRGRIA